MCPSGKAPPPQMGGTFRDASVFLSFFFFLMSVGNALGGESDSSALLKGEKKKSCERRNVSEVSWGGNGNRKGLKNVAQFHKAELND